jgi:hypothetical protein
VIRCLTRKGDFGVACGAIRTSPPERVVLSYFCALTWIHEGNGIIRPILKMEK